MVKKDVLIMCQFFYPEYITSALLPYQTAKALANAGISVDVLTGYPKEYSDTENVPRNENIRGINIKRINYLQLSRGNFLFRIINYLSFIVSMFFRLLSMRNYKVIIVYSNPPILPLVTLMAKKIFNVNIVFVAYDLYPEVAIQSRIMSESSILTKIMNWINKKIYPIADVVALSNDMRKFIIKNRNILPEKVHVINNWATEENRAMEINLLNNIKQELKEPFIISYLGNMGILQEFETLLKAMSHPKIQEQNVELHLAGHGNQRGEISDFIIENELSNVKLHGYLQGKEFEKLTHQTDIFFLSLKNRINGLAVPSKFYTYLLKRKPILAVINQESDIAKEISNHKIGYSVNPGDVSGLVNAIINIMNLEYPEEDIYSTYYTKNIQLQKYIILVKNLINKE